MQGLASCIAAGVLVCCVAEGSCSPSPLVGNARGVAQTGGDPFYHGEISQQVTVIGTGIDALVAGCHW